MTNPYGDGNALATIVRILTTVPARRKAADQAARLKSRQQRTIFSDWIPLVAFRVSTTSCDSFTMRW